MHKQTEDTLALHARIEDLESRLAFQEDSLNAINIHLLEQDKDVAKLQLQLQHLNNKLRALEPESDPGNNHARNEKPPHY